METMVTSHDNTVVLDGSSRGSVAVRHGTILYNLLAQPLDRISRKRSSPQLSTAFQVTVPGHHPLQTDCAGSCEVVFNGTVRRQSMPVVPTVQWLTAAGTTPGSPFTALTGSSSLASSSSSLASSDSVGGRSNGGSGGGAATGAFSEAMVEVARVRLGRLSTTDQDQMEQQTLDVEVDVDDDGQDALCDRHQVSAPPPEPRRKHSEASRMAGLIRRVAARQQQQQQQQQRGVAGSDVTAHKRLRCDAPVDEGFDDYDETDSTSSAATRGRSYTLSVCGDQGLNNIRRLAYRTQPVALAKKMLLPVTGRVAELLRKTVDFARSLPEFQGLSLSDRIALLSNACPRLLLLYMAEVNLQFAVAAVREEQVCDVSAGASAAAAAGARSVQQAATVTPTKQFADTVQSFLAKCQKLEISSSEYFYMRLITLFHTGCTTVENSEAVSRVYNEARQDLQDLSLHQRPTERLRYSTLLLTLHTLFSVHCGMLYTLLCPQQQQRDNNNDSSSGFHAYISRQLRPTVTTATGINY